MTQGANAWAGGVGGATAATVKSVAGRRVEVTSPTFGAVSAQLAIAGSYRPRPRDTVLVIEGDGAHYVVGVLSALREVETSAITAEDGSSAALERDEGGPVWRLWDAEGRLVFEHRAGKSVMHVAEDLELAAGGDLVLRAGREVRVESGEAITARALGPIELCSEVSGGASAMQLDGDRARLTSAHVSVAAERADVKVTDANLVAKTLRTVAYRILERADRVERTADRVVERAREAFREIEELDQTKAGRLRLVAETALSLLGRSTTVKAREDVKVQGEKIHLG